jgi:hypothetical protein
MPTRHGRFSPNSIFVHDDAPNMTAILSIITTEILASVISCRGVDAGDLCQRRG